MQYLGDYDTTETVVIPFNTFSSDDPSASVTVTDLAQGDIEIHKDGSTTQRSSDSGVAVTINFDGITGNHIVTIDLSDNSDAGYYAAGSRYQVRLEGITVDGATLNVWIGTFSIGCVLRPTTDGRTLDVSSGGAAGVDWANVESPTTAVDLSQTDIQLCDTVTTNSDMRGTDSAALASVVGALADAAAAGDPTSADTLMQYVKQLINVLVGSVGLPAFPAEQAPANDVNLAEVIRAIHTDTSSTLDALIKDVPTVAEFEARTIVSADYVVVGDTIAGVTNVGTVTGNVNGSVGSVTGAVGSVTGAVGSVTGNVGGNVVGSVASVSGAVGSVTGNVGGNITGTIGSLAAQAKIDVNTEVKDVLTVDTGSEVTVPAAAAPIAQQLQFIFQKIRNKEVIDAGAGTATISNDAGAAVATSAITDAANVFTKGEYA
ncbi:MAG: hypothetical protein ACXABY_11335 [Candidatus Thorarchaeota archaeon]|jgi:hypothetical protein